MVHHSESEPHHSDHRSHHPHQAGHGHGHGHGPPVTLGLASIPFKRPGARHHQQHGASTSAEMPSELNRILMHKDQEDSPQIYRQAAPPPVRGNPGPFGLLCFGMTTDMLMFIQTGWAEPAFLPTVFAYAAFYGGLGQLIAGILELIKGNTFAGTAFSSYGCFWMGWFMWEYLTYTNDNPALYQFAMTGKTLWCGLWAFLTAGFFVVTLRKNGGLMTIFSTLVVTFALLAGGQHNKQCATAAGYVGFLCGSSAIYTALGELYHEELGITLPGIAPVRYI